MDVYGEPVSKFIGAACEEAARSSPFEGSQSVARPLAGSALRGGMRSPLAPERAQTANSRPNCSTLKRRNKSLFSGHSRSVPQKQEECRALSQEIGRAHV